MRGDTVKVRQGEILSDIFPGGLKIVFFSPREVFAIQILNTL